MHEFDRWLAESMKSRGNFRSPDCTLTAEMNRAERTLRGAALAAFVGLLATGALRLSAQQRAFAFPLSEPSEIALPLPEDRGAAALAQSLRRLGTTARVMMIVAHPDDEDGALLTYLCR